MIKQKLATFLLISLLFFGTNAFAQKHTIIIYRYNQDSIKKDSFNFPLMENIGNFTLLGRVNSYPGKLDFI